MSPLIECLTLSLTIFSAVFIGLYFYFIRNFNFWKKLGVPYPKPMPFLGNLKETVLQKVTIANYLKNLYDEYSDKPYVGIFSFDQPGLLVRDLDLVKSILVKDSNIFADRNATINRNMDPLIAKSVGAERGQRWRQLRVNLSPAFASNKMKSMFYLVVLCCKDLTDFLYTESADGSPVDVRETMAKYTTDVIASCAFGIQSHSLKHPDAEFWGHLRNIFHFSIKKGLVALLWFFRPSLTAMLKLKFLDDRTADYMRKTVWSTVEYREKTGLVRRDFLDSIMELRKRGQRGVQEDMKSAKESRNESVFEIDGDDFVAQAFIFLIAGFETSATTMGFALHELAMHPDIQQRLRAEITRVMAKHKGEVTYEALQEMSYLDMVVSETLRKYPVLPFVDRFCSSDYPLPSPTGNGTVMLPKGTAVFIPIFAFHYDPQYYPDPDKFDPEHFNEENKQNRPNYAYLPFGEGPRVCIGKRFGLMQVKAGLSHILSCFEVAPCRDTPRAIVFDTRSFTLAMKGDIPLSFRRLNQM